jgi:hypothetical protein
MLISFNGSGELGTIFVNPDQVTRVSKNHNQADCCLIFFGKDDWVSVLGTVEDVGSRIRSAGMGKG